MDILTKDQINKHFHKFDSFDISKNKGKLLCLAFFDKEPSRETLEMRLLLGFAANKLGMGLLELGSQEATSLKKGETLTDTLRILMSYSDVLAIRDPEKTIEEYIEMANLPAEGVQRIPIINAGSAPPSTSQESSPLFIINPILDMAEYANRWNLIEGWSLLHYKKTF